MRLRYFAHISYCHCLVITAASPGKASEALVKKYESNGRLLECSLAMRSVQSLLGSKAGVMAPATAAASVVGVPSGKARPVANTAQASCALPCTSTCALYLAQ